MEIFDLMKQNNQEQLAFYTDKSVKLRAILAIHSTALGPAMGGVRIYKYKTLEEASTELIRLSRAMTYKAAAAELNFGGGQIVVVEQEGMEKKEPLFRALGRFIQSFKGRFIASEDVGMTEECMEYVAMETCYITGLPAYQGGSGKQSYTSAYGTLIGMRAAAKHKWGSDDLSGKKVVIQGYGRIGSKLADLAQDRGAKVMVSDRKEEKLVIAKKLGFDTVSWENVLSEPCDIFSPCAVGPVVTPETADSFNCKIIAGAANNQLLSEEDDLLLRKRDILYAPDFIINAGGFIAVSEEYLGYRDEKVMRKIENIYDRLLGILATADKENISTNLAAIQHACKRIESVKHIKGNYLGKGKCKIPVGVRNF